MTPTEQARRSDALYFDDTANRRELCNMVARREAEIGDLRELVRDLWPRASFVMNERTTNEFKSRLKILRVEVGDGVPNR